jgi:hypothetical protein
MSRNSRTSPGGTITYSIWVWSTVKAHGVKASTTSSSKPTRQPRFTLCPAARKTTCSIGTLPANQAFGLKVTDKVRGKATPGAPITFTVTVSGTSLSPAEASVRTAVARPGSPTPTSTPVPTLPPTTLPPTLPPGTLIPVPGTTVTPPNLTGLFPTVTPQPTSSSAGPASSSASHGRKPVRTTQVSSALPLDPRLIGGQLIGLAVLAAAITMVVARLSLRTPQPASPGQRGDAPGAPAPDGQEPGARESAAADITTGPEPPAS